MAGQAAAQRNSAGVKRRQPETHLLQRVHTAVVGHLGVRLLHLLRPLHPWASSRPTAATAVGGGGAGARRAAAASGGAGQRRGAAWAAAPVPGAALACTKGMSSFFCSSSVAILGAATGELVRDSDRFHRAQQTDQALLEVIPTPEALAGGPTRHRGASTQHMGMDGLLPLPAASRTPATFAPGLRAGCRATQRPAATQTPRSGPHSCCPLARQCAQTSGPRREAGRAQTGEAAACQAAPGRGGGKQRQRQ